MLKTVLKRTEARLFSIQFRFDVQHGHRSEVKHVRLEDGLYVSVSFFSVGDRDDSIVITGGTIDVDDNLKGREFARAITAAARLLDLDPIEYMRMIVTAAYDRPWSIEVYPPRVTPMWRELVLGASSRTIDGVMQAIAPPVLSAAGGWAFE